MFGRGAEGEIETKTGRTQRRSTEAEPQSVSVARERGGAGLVMGAQHGAVAKVERRGDVVAG
ncbi:hypothetical protein, partial [Streptomyces rhizosphaericus]|uniref:hypothetical protein n=1 Tax=Streptomyces rhizosphaericus TaxID=114699 RepID=UPI0031DBD5EE